MTAVLLWLVFLAILGMFLVLGYRRNRERFGETFARRNLRSSLFWILLAVLCGVAIEFLPEPWPTWVVVAFDFAVAVIAAAYIIRWSQRRYNAGVLLVRLRPQRHNKRWLFYGGLFFSVLALLQTIATFGAIYGDIAYTDTATRNLWFLCGQAVLQWALAAFLMAAGLAPTELRDRGIYDRLSVLPWKAIDSYRWEGENQSQLIVSASRNFPFFAVCKQLSIPPTQRPEVASIVANKCG
ncbi:hypothetical protein [Baaleninema sp.]|uniref:hypothetical protein n=1 Tax=Baaleninema sp. TaxID=3101197 RepID=UPI003D01EA5C